jgi:beta propeller domain-containing protein
MKRSLVAAVGLGFMVLGAMSCSHESHGGISTKVPMVHAANPVKEAAKTMTAFHSDAELAKYLHEVAAKQRRVMRMYDRVTLSASLPAPASAANAKASAGADQEESITNVQHAGVDEGGIVKAHGNYLVVLRRGRLFTVSIEGGDLRPTSVVDSFGPDINPCATWYDENVGVEEHHRRDRIQL